MKIGDVLILSKSIIVFTTTEKSYYLHVSEIGVVISIGKFILVRDKHGYLDGSHQLSVITGII